MRFVAVFMLIVLLSGCGEQALINRGVSLRQKITESSGCHFACTITADYLEKIYSFSLDCSFDSAGNMVFSVIKPESISGITGTIDHEGGKLTFDENVLAFEQLADGYISPVCAPWLFMKTLRGGYIESCSQDGDLFRLTLQDSYLSNIIQTDIWLNGENMPVACEILWKGRKILSLEVGEFSIL